MEGNLLLEQFSRYKKLELEASPFHFLLDANIELNPPPDQCLLRCYPGVENRRHCSCGRGWTRKDHRGRTCAEICS